MTTETTYGDAIPSSIIVPSKDGTTQGNGKAGNLFISGGKLYFNPTDAGAIELITSA